MKSLFRIFILFSFLISAAAISNAKDNGRVSGNITSLSGNPIQNATIRIFREAEEGGILNIAKSDNYGFFKSAILTPGIYYLQVSHQEYQPVTTAKFIVDQTHAISLDIALEEFIGYISRDNDPRNWDPKTVMRSTSDRRLIFRNSPEIEPPAGSEEASPFIRSGAMSIASNTPINGGGYLIRPQASQSGVSSNFALAEPLSSTSRLILSGQMDIGNGSFYRMRNTYNYRPDSSHDYKISAGYGLLTGRYPSSTSISSDTLDRESGLETVDFNLEGMNKFLDLWEIKYSLDYSRLHYGSDKSFLSPSIQILLTPMEGWSFQASLASRRPSDTNSIILPDGEILNLSEPTLISFVGDRVSMSQVRHSEFAVQKTFPTGTSIEGALYTDYTRGPGIPLQITTIAPYEKISQLIEMNEDHSRQKGLRITLKQKVFDYLNGYVAYIYGESRSIVQNEEPISSTSFQDNPVAYLRQHYQHSLTGRIDATLPVTQTTLLATVRWNSGNPLTVLDWFSDRMDIGTRSANLEARQTIPVPEFLGATGRWEVMISLRNLLNQGSEVIDTTNGEMVLNRNPRSLRFGLNYSFR